MENATWFVSDAVWRLKWQQTLKNVVSEWFQIHEREDSYTTKATESVDSENLVWKSIKSLIVE